MLHNVKERIDSGAGAEQIFHMLDEDCSGELDFEEFKEVMKYYNLTFSEERLKQIFSKFDADGSGQMDV